MKKGIVFVLLICFLFPNRVFAVERVSMSLEYDGEKHVYENFVTTLIVNGDVLKDLPMPPVILQDYTYVPVREVFEHMGAVVDWKDCSREIYIGHGDNLIVMEIGKPVININNVNMSIPVAPRIINDKTMIPVRFASELFGFDVGWNDATRTVTVNEPPPKATPTPTPPAVPNETFREEESTSIDIEADKSHKKTELSIDVSAAAILTETNPETKITGIVLPERNGTFIYQIQASSRISRVEKLLLQDNRMVLDIHNAEMALPKTTYTVENNQYLSRIRAGQNQITPTMVTRIVFDFALPVSYTVGISDDRKTITVAFEKNTVSGVTFASDSFGDTIEIEGKTPPVVNINPMSDPERLVIDLPLSNLSLDIPAELRTDGSTLVRSVGITQTDQNTARITAGLEGEVSYSVTAADKKTVIRITKPTYRNISYNAERRQIVIPKAAGITGYFNEYDQYHQLRYVFEFQNDYSGHFGYGEYRVRDGYIDSVAIETVGGKTRLTVLENRILAYTVTQDDSNIYINALHPKQKYSKIVVIDPGHGGTDTGARGVGAMTEKDINLSIAEKALAYFESIPGIKAYSTRRTDVKPSLEDRTAFGNDLGDVFVSVHINASNYNPDAAGSDVFRYNYANAALTGHSMRLAEITQRNFIRELQSFDRGVKTDNFQVLRDSKIPAVLCEIGFLTNMEEARKLETDEYRTKSAWAVYSSIAEFFETYSPAR